ncbi:MAG TPA: MBL fold metallo-hydrolase [Candidatus Kapabacteria bacterium]|nr:MBL fold metallo-hydrolase [Candidatus Kapabacteria bacterium]HPO63461.1 MBL fold metallo-hydrolase [Candidatus Kapabacteria bacterium]
MKIWKTKSGYEIYQLLSGRSNVFFLKAKGINILIDTSTKRYWKKLNVKLLRLEISKIDFLILTHSHHDHASNANRIKQYFGAKVIIHTEEATYLENGKNPLIKGTNFITKLIVSFGKSLFSKMKYERCKPDILVEQQYDFEKKGLKAKIIHTPGHSVGSVSLIVDNEIAIVGDTLFGVFKNSVLPPYTSDNIEMLRSWKKLYETGCNYFLSGHGKEKSRKDLENSIKKYSAILNLEINEN